MFLGFFITWDAGSNPLKQFSVGGDQLLDLFVTGDAGSNLPKRISAGVG